jgi:hypothetical protein
MLNIFFLFFSFWFSNQSNADQGHKFYVSTTTIEFKMDTKSLQITSQLFTDDIESIVQNINEGLSLDPDSDQEVINQLISNYFKQTLKFTSEGSVIDYVFLGKEYKNDITKCYLELNFSKVPSQIELFNGLFLSLFEEQQNIVHFKNLGERKSFLLHKNNSRISLVLSP